MKHLKQYYTIVSVLGISFLNGCFFGWNAPAIPKLLDSEQTTLDHALSDEEVSVVTTISMIFAQTIIFSSFLNNKIGRKKVLLVGASVQFISWILITMATSYWTLCLGKFIGGQGFAFGYQTSVVYLTEISSDKMRGYALSSCCLFINAGMLTMFIVGPFVDLSWLSALPAFVSVAVFVALLFVPESPVYYLNQGNELDAVKSMKHLGRPMSDLVTDDQKGLMADVNPKESRLAMLKELLFVRKNLKSLVIVSLLNFGQQSCGSIPVLFFVTIIFEQAGSSVEPYVATIIVGIIQLLSVFLCTSLVECLGRKPLYLLSCAFTALAQFALGLSFYLDAINSPLKQYVLWLPLASTVIFNIAYCIGFGTLTNVLAGELLDTRVRSLGTSIAFTVENFSTLFFLFTFKILSSYLGTHNVFWMYGAFCVCSLIFVSIFVPETKGKSIDEIQELLK